MARIRQPEPPKQPPMTARRGSDARMSSAEVSRQQKEQGRASTPNDEHLMRLIGRKRATVRRLPRAATPTGRRLG
jgi:hypothetical protein